jgi:AcrR family transcriptional regulator
MLTKHIKSDFYKKTGWYIIFWKNIMAGKGTQTRQHIIEKSLQLFSVKGYYNTSISDILEATGLTKGGLYGHFSSKEQIWYAVYDAALNIWRDVVFSGIQSSLDPLLRIQTLIENDIKNKLGNNVFEGGCFFHSMLVEFSGQSPTMSNHILQGFIQLAGLLCTWLEEADQQGLLKKDLDFQEIANYIIISLNGAAALYASSRDPVILDQAVTQLHFYIQQLKK